MRIAVIGTHGTGKTSLVEEFLKLKPNYEVIPEIAREMIQKDVMTDSMFDFQLELLKRKILAENTLRKGA